MRLFINLTMFVTFTLLCQVSVSYAQFDLERGKVHGYLPFREEYQGQDTFDFAPRSHIVLFDDYSKYQKGVFPESGYKHYRDRLPNNITVQRSEQYSWLDFYIKLPYQTLSPKLDNNTWLRDSFTIELDFAFNTPSDEFKFKHFNAYFEFKDATNASFTCFDINDRGYFIYNNQCFNRSSSHDRRTSAFEGRHPEDFNNQAWHHLAISVQKGAFKIYVDKHRLISYSKCRLRPAVFRMGGAGALKFRNLKIATGPLESPLSNILTDDKLVTHAIIFEVNKAAIALSGKRYLKELANFLSEHSEIKLEISGHTDNDGTPENNLKLSQARANAVKKHLKLLGIDESRLTAKGYGENRPLKLNSSPEGKQENRRVEFRKIRMP